MPYSLIGKDFTPPDVRAKVTGKARYAEDFRAEGMAFCKLLTSPHPHARVTAIDASGALAMPGVYGVLVPDDLPAPRSPIEAILTKEPTFVGDPILAVAAVDEKTAADAVDEIRVTYEQLPFVVDPLASLRPGGINAHAGGNHVEFTREGPKIREIKWKARDFVSVQEGQLPAGEATVEWEYGDVQGGFASAEVVLDETFVTASNPHHSMEPRSALAYWENGK